MKRRFINRIKRFLLPKGVQFIKTEVQGYTMALDLNVGYMHTTYYSGNYEPETSAFLRSSLRASDTFVDVGAGGGYFSLLAASVGAEVLAFEADPAMCRIFRYNMKANDLSVKLSQSAASDENGENRFYVNKNGSLSSLYPRQGTSSILTVPTKRLDDVIEHADIVKIDVEGAEIKVLRGMPKLLEKVRYLVVEFVPERQGFSDEFFDILDGWEFRGLDEQNMLCWRDGESETPSGS
jgi:FkbM family methyltransferase